MDRHQKDWEEFIERVKRTGAGEYGTKYFMCLKHEHWKMLWAAEHIEELEAENANLLDWKEELLQALEGAAYFMIGMCHDPAVKIMQKEALTGKAKKLLAIVERHLTESDNQETSLDELAALLEEGK